MYCQAMTTGVKLVSRTGGTAGHEGGKNEAGQDDHGPLHAHADIGLDELLPRETGPFSGEGRQRDRGQGSKNVEAEKAAIDRHNEDEGHHRDKQVAQHGYQPEGDAG